MGSLSRALAQEKGGDYRDAARTLFETIDDAETDKSAIAEWLATCLDEVGAPAEAASWFEAAAQLALAADVAPAPRRVAEALYFLERAVGCHHASGNEDAAERVTVVARVLAKSCPPA
jgi:hypothetical protein